MLELSLASIADRLPPANLEAEEAVLGGILLDPSAIARVADILRPEAFTIEAHQTIYRAAVAIASAKKTVDLMIMATWLADRDLLDRVGGQAKLAQLVDRTVSAVNIDRYADLLMTKYFCRRIITAGHETIRDAYDPTLEPDEIIERATKRLLDIKAGIALGEDEGGARPIGDVLKDLFDTISAEAEGEATKLSPIPTHFEFLDKLLPGGFPRSCLSTILGGSGTGKTTFSIELAHRTALEGAHSTLYFSLEMQDHQVGGKFLSRFSATLDTPVNSRLLFNPKELGQRDWEAIANTLGHCADLPFFIDDNPNPSLAHIESEIIKLKERTDIPPLGSVFVDYAQLLRFEGGKFPNKAYELARIAEDLRIMAKRYHIALVALLQPPKETQMRENKRLGLYDCADSSGFVKEAAVALTLYAPPEGRVMEIAVAKNRYGPSGDTIEVGVNYSYGQFTERKSCF